MAWVESRIPTAPIGKSFPRFPESVATNQQVLYALAKGTGGFEIFNTNDFLQGLRRSPRK